MHPTTNQWIALAAIVIGALVQALKTDGASKILTHIAGRDVDAGDKPVTLPKNSVPFLVLVLGGGAAGLAAVVEGATWSGALWSGLHASAGAVFGHQILKRLPKLGGGGGPEMLAIGFSISLVACSPQAQRALKEYLADKADCAIRNMNLPNEEILKRCAIDTNDADQIFRMVSAAREEAAREANAAAARQREEDERRAVAGCGGYRDGGAR